MSLKHFYENIPKQKYEKHQISTLAIRKDITEAYPMETGCFSYAIAQYILFLKPSIDHSNGAGIASLSRMPIVISSRT